MARDDLVRVPVWTIATEPSKVAGLVPRVPSGEITPERLEQLRDGLASLLDTPVVSLEAYPLPLEHQVHGGRVLDATTPLALSLTSLIQHSSEALRAAAPTVSRGGETLYRMVVPAKVAAQMGQGIARSMPSTQAAAGIYSGVLGPAGIVGQATFVPVTAAAVASSEGAAGVAAAGASGAVAAGGVGAITVAAPLVLLAIAVAATVYAEEQRRRALERITALLTELKQARLDDERDALRASSKAIDKAAAVLLDEGKIGHSLGLDSAVHNIDTAVEAAARRASEWQQELDSFENDRVSVERLRRAFPGIDQNAGEFRARLRMAAFAIATKRRIAVLQAVEHAQQGHEMTLPRFMSVLRTEQEAVDDLERQLASFLLSLARVQIQPPERFIDNLMTRGEVRDLLKWPTRLRELAESESPSIAGKEQDLEIAMVRDREGRVRVLGLAAVA
ncbi:hypothetical protein [Nostocoides sp. Soil756]|jgi:hypothetical protein|uniref:hypothetical protein n=1 Tax=Nostocoides sp. Soil756 TaxID=1736399 RepID=UPI0006F36441|nr:hypothetical protein [Tetrasphaera sp. Soil756]KRE63559.1 hypothetical protein ASG78_01255 [Tetrasphaera sp. Soil756]